MQNSFLLACVLLCQATPKVALPSDTAVLTSVFAQFDEIWRARRDECGAAAYKVTGTGVIPSTAYAEQGNPVDRDHTFPIEVSYLLDLRGNRFRIERTNQLINISTKSLMPEHELWTHMNGDLRVHHVAVTRNRGPVYSAAQPEFTYRTNDYPVLTLHIIPVFTAHGYLPSMYVGGDRQSIGNLETRYFEGNGWGEVDGRECAILRAKRTPAMVDVLEMWVDRSSGAVLRLHKFEGDVLESSADVDIEVTTQWRLNGWRSAKMNITTGEPANFYTYVVKVFQPNPQVSDADFTQEPKAGMVVRDAKARTVYVLGETGSKVPINIALARKRDEGGVTSRTLAWGGVALIAIVSVLCGAWLWKRRSPKAMK